jgi:hypothetical protein
MSTTVEYMIDESRFAIDYAGSPATMRGLPMRLSNAASDPVHGRDWYPRGFHVAPLLAPADFDAIYAGVSSTIRQIVRDVCGDRSAFPLEHYHQQVTSDVLHLEVVRRTRDLFAPDVRFPVLGVMAGLERILGFGLTDIDPADGERIHIILRINRPRSRDFNPPHKDIYEAWDAEGRIPAFVNFWIPICGVNAGSSLPLAPGSHLLPESRIERTSGGAMVDGRQYRVRGVLAWDGSTALHRPAIRNGEVLVFSSHLIHGCAFNANPDQTRVALEFRLFRKP